MRLVILFFLFLFVIQLIFAPIAAPDTFLTAQVCNQEDDQGTPNTYSTSCDGNYPGICSASGDLLSCNDGFSETVAVATGTNNYDGVRVNASNSSITDCGSITSVQVCYEWWVDTSRTFTSCKVAVDADGGLSYSNNSVTCPGTSVNPGVTCTNVTSNETWVCSNFFGAASRRAIARNEIRKTSTGTTVLNTDVLYFNVTYDLDTAAPTVANTSANYASIGVNNLICINATVNDVNPNVIVSQVVFPNSTISNVTLTASGCNAGSASDAWYGGSVNTGTVAGTLIINTTFANDSNNNFGNQDPYPNVQVTVTNNAPVVANTSRRFTSIGINNAVCINATAMSNSTVNTVLAQVVSPDGTVSNTTLTASGCLGGTATDAWYGGSFNTGILAGTYTINTTFANDSVNTFGSQSPYPNLQVNSTFGNQTFGNVTDLIDSFMQFNTATTNYGTSALIQVYPWDGVGTMRGILSFNLSGYIPAQSTINSAALFLRENSTLGSTRTLGLHKVNSNRNWTESGVTWNKYTSASSWTTGGGDFNTTSINNTITFSTLNWTSWNALSDVQIFVDNFANAFGWILKDETEDTSQQFWYFNSKDSAWGQPYLQIYYVPASLNVANTSRDSSSVSTNANICINATVNGPNAVSVVLAQIIYPDATISNVTLSDTGCNAGGAGDNWYGATVNVGSTVGTLYINTTFANDTLNKVQSYQSPYANLAVTVSEGASVVETTVNVTTVTFGSLDPGTADTAASNNPVRLTNTANSNTAVDVYLNGTNMTSGANQINSSNISVWTANTVASSRVFNASTYFNSTSANTGFIENLAISGTTDFYFWLDVDSGQTAGSYTGTMQIRVVADGATP